jgi:hypothetical protein
LNFDFIPLEFRRVQIFKDSSLRSSMLGIGIFTDAGLLVIYDSDSVQVVTRAGEVMLRGTRDPITKLWMMNTSSTPAPHGVNNVIHFSRHADRALFYNRCFGSCANSTMVSALRSGILKIPDLPTTMYTQNMPNQVAQAYGHLDRSRKGQRSTRRPSSVPSLPSSEVIKLEGDPCIYVKDFSLARMHADATGQFPVTSVRGYSYDLLFYVEEYNYIHVELLRDRSASSYTDAYRRAFEFFQDHKVVVRIVRLDNETSTSLLRLFTNLGIRPELAPPSNHRTLHAERHIRTWKNHFVSTLSTCDPSFPLDAWEYLLPQAEATLNLLRPSASCPTKSAWEHVCGAYDCNAVPLAPPGTRAVILDPANKRPSWAKHGTDCFYVGPAFSHYRCYTFYIPSTRSTRVSDSVA